MTTPERKGATRRLVSMGISYSMGTFNDNFIKQAALLLAASLGKTGIQGVATFMFALPFVVFSAWAGWLADRVSKKNVIVFAKSTELLSMLLALWSLYTLNWFAIVLVVFLMGVQSTFFSPAINGSIPESFPATAVPRVNALLKLATTASILLGIALAGPLLDIDSFFRLSAQDAHGAGRWAVGVTAILVAVLGLVASLCINARKQTGKSDAPFPQFGPLDSAKQAIECAHSDKELFSAVQCEAFFYVVSTFALLCITNLGSRLGFSFTSTSLLSVALGAGICAGSLKAGSWPVQQWSKRLKPSGLGMTAGLFLSGFSSLLPEALALPVLLVLYVITGLCGGFFLIPVVSFEQVRPKATEKGRLLGISNFMTFSGIMLSGTLFSLLSAFLPPTCMLGVAGLAGALFVIWMSRKLLSLRADDNNAASDTDGDTCSNSPAFSQKPCSGHQNRLTLAALRPGFIGSLLRIILALRYRIRVTGLDTIAQHENGASGIIFAPNHPGLMDPPIVYSVLAGSRPRPMSDAGLLQGPLGALIKAAVNPVAIPDLSKHTGRAALDSINQGLAQVGVTLKRGDNVLFYPAGRIYRGDRESLGGNSGLQRILEAAPDARLVLVRTTGLWGSTSSFAGAGGNPDLSRFLLRGLVTLLGNLVFFTPRREVLVELTRARILPATDSTRTAENGPIEDISNKRVHNALQGREVLLPAERKAMNAALEDFYNARCRPPLYVPRFFWQSAKPADFVYRPGRGAEAGAALETAIPQQVRDSVYKAIRDEAGLADDVPITPGMALNADLGLDSLALMNVAVRLEESCGQTIDAMENLVRVEDLLLAAAGLTDEQQDRHEGGLKASVANIWREHPKANVLRVPDETAHIADAFLRHTRRSPGEPVAADRKTALSRRKTWVIALLLRKKLAALPGERVGVLLPATPMVTPLWLALMLAGKETVFLNWTVGKANLEHCLKTAGIQTVLTSSALMDRLLLVMPELKDLQQTDDFLPLESLAASYTLLQKITAAFKAFCIRSCKRYPVRDTAAILFTSGTEGLPKGVPLTHRNLLSNAQDIIEALKLKPDLSILAMLPPFHSFGLMADAAIPMSLGVRAAFHPNPTEAGKLNAVVRDFGITLIAASPTFLTAMLDRAALDVRLHSDTVKTSQDVEVPETASHTPSASPDLASVRYVFVGAEKCPQSLEKSFARLCPEASLCEGYGITECSPVIAVNRPGHARSGTVGQPLPHVTCRVVREENGVITGRCAEGETGMLLVRGPSIFSGYLQSSKHDDTAPASPFVEFENVSWYRTGDLVSMDGNGFITFRGRLKRFVKIGGEMISLPQMESVLLTYAAARTDKTPAGNAAHPVQEEAHGPLLAVEAREDASGTAQPEIILFTTQNISMAEANAALRQAGLSPLYAVRRVVKLEAIPLLGTGKTDYRALRALV